QGIEPLRRDDPSDDGPPLATDLDAGGRAGANLDERPVGPRLEGAPRAEHAGDPDITGEDAIKDEAALGIGRRLAAVVNVEDTRVSEAIGEVANLRPGRRLAADPDGPLDAAPGLSLDRRFRV